MKRSKRTWIVAGLVVVGAIVAVAWPRGPRSDWLDVRIVDGVEGQLLTISNRTKQSIAMRVWPRCEGAEFADGPYLPKLLPREACVFDNPRSNLQTNAAKWISAAVFIEPSGLILKREQAWFWLCEHRLGAFANWIRIRPPAAETLTYDSNGKLIGD